MCGIEENKRVFVRRSLLWRAKNFRRSTILNMRKEVFKYLMIRGNTRIILHSNLMRLTEEERREWFRSEMEKGNPILKNIERIVNKMYWENVQRDAEDDMRS